MRGARWHTLGGAMLMGLSLVLMPRESTAQRRNGRSAKTRAVAPPAASSPAAAAPAPEALPDPKPSARRRMVVVDAGHGGVDRGMSGPIGTARKIYEKDITLAVARQLQTALESRGIGVLMTRTRDTLIALGDRGRIANQAKGDLFVSVHVNAANLRWNDPGAARGYETYFLAEAKTEDERRVEAMENEVIKFETTANAHRDDPLGFIIRDMAQNEHLRESARLATLVQQGLGGIHPGPSRGVKQAGFMVLVKAFMPAILVEIGFGTNAADAAYIADPDQQRRMASVIAAAIEDFLTQYERKVGGPT